MPKDHDRPYFNHAITQLEALFEAGRADISILHALDLELHHRATDRAATLRKRVAGAASALLAPAPSPQTPRPATATPPIRNLTLPAATPPPNRPDTPAGILGAWTALEALSPQTYRRPEDLAAGDRGCVAGLDRQPLPWEAGERSRPNRQLYYQVMFGAIPMDRATEDLVKAFGADEEQRTRIREKAAIAAVLVDRNGIVVEDKGVAVSSFAWALPLALDLQLGALGAWPGIEPKIVGALDALLRRTDSDGKPLPLDRATIDRAYRWVVDRLGLPAHLVEPPAFAIRVFHYFKARNPPEVSLLNSFYMADLTLAAARCEDGTAPAGLRRYLGLQPPAATLDLLTDNDAVENAISPAKTPAARWPGPGGHPLVLLQQAAVNLARQQLAGRDGIVAVNGPPGTGKTTLLRDIVAASVLDRAIAMAAFDDPAAAFTPSGQKQAFGGTAFFHLYRLDPSLRGHEVLVASSNNKAVENVSRELPAAKAVGRPDLAYFKSIADLVHAPREADDAEGDETHRQDPVETWGLIAAVLGNGKNRAAFQKSFWWDDYRSFRVYLKAAKGDSLIREIKDPVTGKIVERRTPAVILAEQPPTPAEAKVRWRKARRRLLTLKQEVDDALAALEAVRQRCRELALARTALAASVSALGLLAERQALRPERPGAA